MIDYASRINALRAKAEWTPPLKVSLLDDPIFTNSDVEAACYVTATQLHNWVSRGWIRLTAANPGRGRRRLYTGSDAIAVAVAASLQPFGMMQVAEQLVRVHWVGARARNILTSPQLDPGLALAIVPMPDGTDWLYIQITADKPEPSIPVPGRVVLDLDRLIVETLEKLLLAKAGEQVPQRPFPKTPTPTESEDEFLESTGAAYRDELGRRIYRGLTVEESAAYEALLKRDLHNRMSGNGEHLSPEERARKREFQEHNERARFEHLGATMGADDDPPP